MKKRKEKVDVAEIMTKMQEQMAILEMKLDVLIAKATSPAVTRPVQQQTSQPASAQNQNAGNQNSGNNNFRNKVMHKAVCADCKKDCEVPFKPSGERPVYCKECFSRRKSANSYKPAQDNKPVAPASIPVHPAAHADKPQHGAKKASGGKKKVVAKKGKGKK